MMLESVAPCQQIVKHKPRAQLQRMVVISVRVFVAWNYEGKGLGKRRRSAGEKGAFNKGLEHESEVEMFQVSQSAVDQLRRTARCAGGEVALFNQCDFQSPRRSIKRDSRAGDAAADDENIE